MVQKLSKFKYEDPLMEVQLTEELSGSLRQLKPEGNLVKDRFKYVGSPGLLSLGGRVVGEGDARILVSTYHPASLLGRAVGWW